MKYLFEKLEKDIPLLEAISNQIAFAFSDVKHNISLDDFENIIKTEEPRINIVSLTKDEDKFVVCFDNEELKSEFGRLF